MQYPIVALDLGERRIGVALCPAGTLVFEQPTVQRTSTEGLVTVITQLVKQCDAHTLVVGARRDQTATDELAELQHRLSIPVIVLDEVLTTKEAERQLSREGRRGDTDARAARLILEQFLREAGLEP